MAGENTGDFTVRQADTLARTTDTAPTCVPGAEFTDQVEVKATYQGAAAGKVAATATLIKSADDTTGTFLLRITTADGATLTVELTVAAPAS